MKLDFGPSIATFRMVVAPIASVTSNFSRPHGLWFFRNDRAGAPDGAGPEGLWRRLFQSDHPAWRHRAVTRRQDRLHYGADSRPHPRRPVSGVRTVRDGP